MQKKSLIVAPVFALLILLAFRSKQTTGEAGLKLISRQDAYQKKTTLQCSPDWEQLNIDSIAGSIVVLPGWGNYRWDIRSGSDSARIYFRQGINMYYSFHIIEAMASFKKAAQFDANNAMIHWAQALSYGPNINDVEYSAAPDALAAVQKAVALSEECSAKEKALIKAMSVRYTPDSTVSRTALNQLYANEMERAYLQFPGDADVGALYADALMLQHPWEYWKHNGEAHPWTPRIVAVLEKLLKLSPVHPGANHYYIHAVEASGNPQRALLSAQRLSTLMPSVSHMVHMPSHIFIRSGYYREGIKVNEMSLKGYKAYRTMFPEVVNNAFLYEMHNLHMQAACAMMGAGYAYAAKTSHECRDAIDTTYLSLPAPMGNYIQYIYMTPILNDVRFGKWQSILEAPPVPPAYVFADVLLHWARGMAHTRLNNLSEAEKELAYVTNNMNDKTMSVVLTPFNAPVDAAKVAVKMLEAGILELKQDLPAATQLYKEAVLFEDALIYTEPKDWIIPVRPFLGTVLIKRGLLNEAVTVFKEDLKENPNNHWSLTGLYESLQQLQQPAAAVQIKKQLDSTLISGEMRNLPAVF